MPLNKEADLKLLVTLAMEQPKAFVYENNVSAGVKWEIWLGQLQSYLNACGVKSEIQMIGILFNVAGKRVREIYKTSAAAKDDDDFKAVYQKFLFYELRQSKQESLDDFHVRLR